MIGNKHKAGFTLVEMLVVLGIVVICGSLVANVYTLTARSQRLTSNQQIATSQIRAAVESIAQHVRSGAIDYSYYRDTTSGLPYSIPQPTDALAVYDATDQFVVYRLQGNSIVAENQGDMFPLTNSSDVQVVLLRFYINPVTDPFTEELCSQQQGYPGGCSVGSQAVGGCTEVGSEPANGICRCDDDSDCQVTHHCDTSALSGGVGLCVPYDQQPRVTMVIGFRSVDPQQGLSAPRVWQTTISSRVYRR